MNCEKVFETMVAKIKLSENWAIKVEMYERSAKLEKLFS